MHVVRTCIPGVPYKVNAFHNQSKIHARRSRVPIVTLKWSQYSAAGRDSKGARLAYSCFYHYCSHEKHFCWALLPCPRLVLRRFPLPAVHGLRRWGLRWRREGLLPPPVRRKVRRLPWPYTWPLHHNRCLRDLHPRCCCGGGGCVGGCVRRCIPLHSVRAQPPLLYLHNATSPPPRPRPPPVPARPELPAAQAYPTREPVVSRAAPAAAFPPSP